MEPQDRSTEFPIKKNYFIISDTMYALRSRGVLEVKKMRKIARIGLGLFMVVSTFLYLFPAYPAEALTSIWSNMDREAYLQDLADVWGTFSSDIFAVGYPA